MKEEQEVIIYKLIIKVLCVVLLLRLNVYLYSTDFSSYVSCGTYKKVDLLKRVNDEFKSSDIDNRIHSYVYNKYLSYKDRYEDVVGYININGLNIDYPVFQRKNDFYLNHDRNGEKSVYGEIYLTEDYSGDVLLVNGHNMKDGKMFGTLSKYKEASFANKYRYVDIVHDGLLERYKVFSVFVTTQYEAVPNGFSSEGGLSKYLKMLQRRSMHNLGGASATRLLVMNTCSYEFDNAHLIVCAYRCD